jgi:hypothetical protein
MGKRKKIKYKKRKIRPCDPITIDLIAGLNAVTGDTLRGLMRRRTMFKLLKKQKGKND